MYALVGSRMARRKVEGASRLPLAAFALWWHALAATTLLGGLATLLAAIGFLDHDLYVAHTWGTLFLIAAAFAGLLYYLVFLFTGRWGAWKAIVPAYYAYAVFLAYFLRSHGPLGYEVRGWLVQMRYERPLAEDPLYLLAILLLLGPPIVSALLYLFLAFRVRERTLRYRIVLVSTSLLVWFVSVLAANVTHFSESDAWQWVSRALGLGAALGTLVAYHPPKWLRRRFGLVSIDEPLPAGRGPA